MPAAITLRTDLPSLEFGRYRSVGIPIQAVQINERTKVANRFASDAGFVGKPGDWLVTYGEGPDGTRDHAIVDRRVFEEAYERLDGGSYRKRPVLIEAAQLQNSLDIMTTEGPSHGESGDWVLVGISGECYFNTDRDFKLRYEAVQDDAPGS